MKRYTIIYLLSVFVACLQSYSKQVFVTWPINGQDIIQNAESYPLMLIAGNGVKANPQKAVEILKELQAYENAKIVLAYCLYNGIGTPKDKAGALSLMKEIKSANTIQKCNKYFLNYPFRDIDFVVALCDNINQSTLAAKSLNQILFQNWWIRENREDVYTKIKNRIESDIPQYADTIIHYYIEKRDFDKAFKCIPCLPEHTKKNIFDNIFYVAVLENNPEVAKSALKLINDSQTNDLKDKCAFYIALCMKIGFGCECNPTEADKILDKYFLSMENVLQIESICSNFIYASKCSNTLKAYIFENCQRIAKTGRAYNLALCYLCGYGVKTDYKKAVDLLYAYNALDYYKIFNIFQQIPYENLPDYLKEKRFDALKGIWTRYKDLYIANQLVLCYLNGSGTDKCPQKAVEILKDIMLNNNTGIRYNTFKLQEILAYCTQNGLGVPKDEEKARQMRESICKEIELMSNSNNAYQELKELYADRVSDEKLPYNKELYDFYEAKYKRLANLINENNRSPEEKSVIQEFENICAELKGAKKDKAKKDAAIKKLENFFADMTEKKSPYLTKIAEDMIFSSISFFDLRVAALPLILKSAEKLNNAPLYILASRCYREGKGTACNYEKEADCELNAARSFLKSELRKQEANYHFQYAAEKYGIAKKYEKMATTIAEWQKAFPNENSAKWFEIKLLSFQDTPYFDSKTASEKFSALINSLNDAGELVALSGQTYGAGNIATLSFSRKLLIKAYGINKEQVSDYYKKVLAQTYLYGLSTPQDLKKSVEFIKDYISGNDYYEYDIIKYLIYLKDTGNENALYEIGKVAVEKERQPLGYTLLGLSHIYGWGTPKDEAKGCEFLLRATKEAAPKSKLDCIKRCIIQECDTPISIALPPAIRKDLLNALIAYDCKDYYTLAMGMKNIGEFEKSLEYARKYNESKNGESLELALLAANIDNAESQKRAFELARELSNKPKNHSAKIVYANYLYQGKLCPQDTKKALELLKSIDKIYFGDGLYGTTLTNTYLSLWKIYTESGDTANAEKMKQKILKMKNYGNYTPATMCALILKAKETPFPISYAAIGKNEEYATQWLKIAEEQIGDSRTADDAPFKLASTYSSHGELRNTAKAEQIMEGRREWLKKFNNNELEQIK